MWGSLQFVENVNIFEFIILSMLQFCLQVESVRNIALNMKVRSAETVETESLPADALNSDGFDAGGETRGNREKPGEIGGDRWRPEGTRGHWVRDEDGSDNGFDGSEGSGGSDGSGTCGRACRDLVDLLGLVDLFFFFKVNKE